MPLQILLEPGHKGHSTAPCRLHVYFHVLTQRYRSMLAFDVSATILLLLGRKILDRDPRWPSRFRGNDNGPGNPTQAYRAFYREVDIYNLFLAYRLTSR